jgi:hypothetical protein
MGCKRADDDQLPRAPCPTMMTSNQTDGRCTAREIRTDIAVFSPQSRADKKGCRMTMCKSGRRPKDDATHKENRRGWPSGFRASAAMVIG